MSEKEVSELLSDAFFGATGTALSTNQLSHTVIKRGIRVDRINSIRANGYVAKPAFFVPFESMTEMAAKTVSIPIAPVAFSFEALANILTGLGCAFVSVLRLGIFDIQGAKDYFLMSGTFLLSAGQALCAAIMSPIANLIDLLGSLIMTMTNGFSDNRNFETLAPEIHEQYNIIQP